MLACNAVTHSQPEQSEHQEVNTSRRCSTLAKNVADTLKPNAKRENSSQAFFFMYQMKLLNTLGLVKSVCKPWGTLPHGNDFAYHFHKIATTNSLALLQCYEAVFRTIYDRFDAEGADPANAAASLWAKVEDVDYFKVIYRLECLRHNKPFDNDTYKEMLEQTVHNVDLEVELEQAHEASNFDEVPSWGKYNWESKNRQYSLSALEDETALPSDIDISDVFNDEAPVDDDFDNSDLIYTGINTIEIDDVYINGQSDESDGQSTDRPYNTRNRNEFDNVVMHVISKQNRTSQTTRSSRTSRQATDEPRTVQRNRANSRRTSSLSRDDEDFVAETTAKTTATHRKDDENKRRKKKRVDSIAAQEIPARVAAPGISDSYQEEAYSSRNANVVSASVSYDKRQQRFMAQWKTREGTKHSKSFYAKRYASPIMARKHAELYKMYILQHRGKFFQDMAEPTYEQLAAQNFQALESINITDATLMEDMDKLV
ncbi:hypothetical protein X943_002704 [Babesia divergens]|uniref:AP2/ERF domain-containing protein n=1 Tax=Babesia divergens TaxID=32595 RepID=A0AAD9LLW5_BABDI|nr:hypothetical protein X943_002704 [Babesia divergens]